MRKIIGLLIGLFLLSGGVLAYSSQTTWETGSCTSGAISTVNMPVILSSVLILNDSSTSGEDIYVNLEGDLSAARMTKEAFSLKAGEYIIANDFRTYKIKLLAKTGTITYRVLGTY